MIIIRLTSTTATVAPIGCSVRVDTNRPMAPSALSPQPTYADAEQQTAHRLGERRRAAGQQDHLPASEQGQPDHAADQGDQGGGREREDHDRRVLDHQQPRPTGRHRQQVAQRADVGLAGHRVPGDGRHGQGQEQGQLEVSAAKATNRPLPTMASMKSGPPPPPPAVFTATARMIGTTASTARPAMLRRRRKIRPELGGQEPDRQPPGRGRGCTRRRRPPLGAVAHQHLGLSH